MQARANPRDFQKDHATCQAYKESSSPSSLRQRNTLNVRPETFQLIRADITFLSWPSRRPSYSCYNPYNRASSWTKAGQDWRRPGKWNVNDMWTRGRGRGRETRKADCVWRRDRKKIEYNEQKCLRGDQIFWGWSKSRSNKKKSNWLRLRHC